MASCLFRTDCWRRIVAPTASCGGCHTWPAGEFCRGAAGAPAAPYAAEAASWADRPQLVGAVFC